MAGKHSKRGAHARIPEQRGPRRAATTDAFGIIDARTRVEHLMTDVSAMAYRHSGNYLALCGARVLAASLTEPGRAQCQPCAAEAAGRLLIELPPSTAPGGRPAPSSPSRRGWSW
ncbi:MAG: hypothetical protein ACRDRA_20940 [Pseudonocardiaceae bacterium]